MIGRISKRKKVITVAIFAIVILCGLIYTPWLLSYRALHKLLSEPICTLKEKEYSRIKNYIENENFYYPPFDYYLIPLWEKRISDDLRKEIISIAVQRAVELNEVFLLWETGEEWGGNEVFARMVGCKINSLPENSHNLLIAVGTYSGYSLMEKYVDIEQVLMSEKKVLIVAAVSGLPLSMLFKYKDFCYKMLMNEQVDVIPKKVLIKRIVKNETADKWFKNQNSLLMHLKKIEDPEIQKYLTNIAGSSDGS